MPWLSKTMKDVISCDKPRVGANNLLIRGFPNGATLPIEDRESVNLLTEANPAN